MRQVDRKEVDLALYPGDLHQCLAKIRLSMARIVPQRHKTSRCTSRRASRYSLTVVIPPE